VENSELEKLGVAVQPGSVLLGKYRVDRVIGVGGMGAVIGARHLQLDERVAIKFLLPDMVKHDEVVQRFLREARAAIKIRSEHCVRVFDVGTLENGAPYMVMEFLEGQDLGAFESRQLPVHDVVDWVLQASEALAEAHAMGIVHRDLKPANLFLTRRADGTASVKVLDFGISKQAASGADAGVTKTQAVLGSPRYMSPEQMRSTKDVDGRADIWALGAVIYELIAGAPPFDGETVTSLFAAILQDEPKPLSAWRPDVSPALAAAVRGCLEKDRNRRYASISHFATALAPFGSATAMASAERIGRVLGVRPQAPSAPILPMYQGQSHSQSQPGVGGAVAMAATAMASTTNGAVATPPQAVPLKSSTTIVAAAVATLLVVAGGIGLVAFRHSPSAEPSTGASSPAATVGRGAAANETVPRAAAANETTIPVVAPAPSAAAPAVTLAPVAPSQPPSTTSTVTAAAAPSPAAPPAPRSGAPGKAGAAPRTTPPPATSAPSKPPANNNSNPFGEDRKG
jgi:eukaryotic-like serine/threonine-protein kinase